MRKVNNNTGVIKRLINIDKKLQKKESKEVNVLSILALLISIVSIYLQFFYKKYDLNVSLIDNEIYSDSISLSLIYNNNGNKDATIIKSKIYYFFNEKEEKIYFHEDNKEAPYILSSGNQSFLKLNNTVEFKEFYSNVLKEKDTLRVFLSIDYLNYNYLQSQIDKDIGWIVLDSDLKIKSYKINYQNINLDSDEYFISSSASLSK